MLFFASNLEILLKYRGLSQTEFAKLLESNSSTINNWIKGVAVPPAETLVKISYLLNYSIDAMLKERINPVQLESGEGVNMIVSNINEVSQPYRKKEKFNIDVINNEREMYERLLKEKDERLRTQEEIIKMLKKQLEG